MNKIKEFISNRKVLSSLILILKENIKSVKFGTLSNYDNYTNFNVYISIVNELIQSTIEIFLINSKIKKFASVKLIDSSIIISLSQVKIGNLFLYNMNY